MDAMTTRHKSAPMEAVTAVKILTLLLVGEVSADDEADGNTDEADGNADETDGNADEADGNVGDDVCEDDICVVLGESTAV